MAEFVCQGAVASWETPLDEEDVAVGVLPPLAADAGGQIGHLQFDRTATVIRDCVDETSERHLTTSGCEVENLVDRAGDTTAGWQFDPLSTVRL
ncbi:hypothetical protein MARA_43920 [Mycolicibacterium arabiense]|uniref:Uncharacterized protein n=1 Tax=Mycolicibacterium arabiense TaxID=1286181 RepID=A0A7I7S1X2_9MYCO|nr:hypothetical protein MARA_43920 [Mycolicibacterium arabiense]